MSKEFNCPVCSMELSAMPGGRNRTDGWTLFCNNIGGCMSNEQPLAFGRTREAAYETIMHKWGKHLIKDADTRMPAKKKLPETPAPDSKIDETISYE